MAAVHSTTVNIIDTSILVYEIREHESSLAYSFYYLERARRGLGGSVVYSSTIILYHTVAYCSLSCLYLCYSSIKYFRCDISLSGAYCGRSRAQRHRQRQRGGVPRRHRCCRPRGQQRAAGATAPRPVAPSPRVGQQACGITRKKQRQK